jgi:hypothetical protein
MKGIKILILKSFDIIYDYVKSMVGEWHDILKRWKDICANKNINFHRYLINIHSFNTKHACGLQ